jgi:hypothetical protein
MPPDLSNRQDGAIKKGEEHLLKMFSSDGAALALAATEWDVEEEFRSLIDMARNGDSPRDKLGAIKVLNQRAREIAELNGLVVRGKFTARGQTPDGQDLEISQSSSRLITSLRDGIPSDGNSPFFNRARKPIDSQPQLSREPDSGGSDKVADD